MITAVCANPCIDRTAYVDGLQVGVVNRLRDVRLDPSGKGVNVAIAGRRLGIDSVCLGFLGKEQNQMIKNRLEADGCLHDFIMIDGAVRSNLKLIDAVSGVMTEFNEKGLFTTQAEVDMLIDRTVQWSSKSRYVVLSGSLPPGCPDDLYARIVSRVKAMIVRCVVDTEGNKLRLALEQKPFLIKPNRYELEMLLGRPLPTLTEVLHGALECIRAGANVVAVSLGGEGALITDGKTHYMAKAIPVKVGSTVGAGDSFVTGLVKGFYEGMPLDETFRSGMAAGTAAVLKQGTELFDFATYQSFLPQVRVERLMDGDLA